MKKALVYGTAVLALSAAPLLAQQSSGSSTGSRQGSATGTQSGTQGGSSAAGGSTSSGAGGSTQSGSSGAGGSSQGGSTAGTQSGTRTQGSAAADASKSNPDRQFVMEAAQGGMAEVELGQLATQKASSDAVKQFGQRMVTDHGKANDELKTLAQSKSITLPTDIGKHKATKDKLEKLSGAAFDRAYMQEMLNDHRKDVSDFRKESQSGKDPDVKAWAAKTLPTLEEHLQMAQSASRGAVGTSGTKSGSDTDKTTGGSRGTTDSGSTPRSGGSGTTGTPGSGAAGTGGSTGSPGSGATGSGATGSAGSGSGASGAGSPR